VQVTPGLHSPGLGRPPFSNRVKNRHRKILGGSPSDDDDDDDDDDDGDMNP
jgi:hypothetical protein